MASAGVGEIPELLLLISNHVLPSPRVLSNLCLVNRLFHEVFSPLLYRSVHLGPFNLACLQQTKKIPYLLNDELKHTRSLVATYLHDLSAVLPSEPPLYLINSTFCRLLQKTPRLETFLLYHGDISHDCLKRLSTISSLRNVTLAFSSSAHAHVGLGTAPGKILTPRWEMHGPHFGNPTAYIADFRNLTKLSLVDLWGDFRPWQDCLVRILVQSSGLQQLRLSLAEGILRRAGDSIVWSFFEDICDSYALSTDRVLRLKMLHLDGSIWFPDLETLQRLTEVSALQDISIYNVPNHESLVEFAVPWEVLLPNTTTSLRFLSFASLNGDVVDNIANIYNDTERTIGLRFGDSNLYHDDYDIESILGNSPNTNVTQLLLPADFSDAPLIQSLQGHDALTHLGLVIYQHWLLDNADYFMPILCDMIRDLPNLVALWLDNTVEPRATVEFFTPIVLTLAQAGNSLEYIRIGYSAWSVKRNDVTNIVLLDEWEDRVLRPELFQAQYPSAWAPYSVGTANNWTEY